MMTSYRTLLFSTVLTAIFLSKAVFVYAAVVQPVAFPAAAASLEGVAPAASVASLAQSSQSLPSIDGKLTIQDCIDIALANSPAAVSAKIAVDSASVGVSQAKSVLLPTASASAQQGYTNGETPGTGGRHDHGTTGSSVDAALSISGITDIARGIKKAGLAFEQAALNEENVTNVIVSNVKSNYYALLSAQQAVNIRTKSRDLYRDQFERAQAYYEQGLRPKVDVTTAEVNLNNEILNLIRAKNLVLSSSAKLANTLGVTTNKVLDLDSNLNEEVFFITFDDALSRAYANRPDVRSSLTGLQIQTINVNQAKAGYWPTFSLSATYSKYGDDFYFDSDQTKLLAAVQVPIFSAFTVSNSVKQARLTLADSKNSNRSLLNNVFLEVQSAFIKFNEAAESIPVAKLNVEKAQENLELAQGRYNEGIGDIIALRDAEVSYTDAELNYLTARYDYAIAIAQIKQAMGTR